MKTHINVPVFIPHLGCPNACVFCNQRAISGHSSFALSVVREEIEQALRTKKSGQSAQIAFFGGSFTGIDRGLMRELLEIAASYVADGRADGIRLSTRPDYIDDEILSVLARYPVQSIELGIQSMDDRVLSLCRRGHTAADSRAAAQKVKAAGFELVAQMMIGLPGATPESERATALACCEMGADAARIYPTVVFRQSELCKMTQKNQYTPLSDDAAVERTKEALFVFYRRNIPCIRIGLCASENLSATDTYFAGPNHPALGELVRGALFLDLIRAALDREKGRLTPASRVTVMVAPGALSRAIGQRGANRAALQNEYTVKSVNFVEISGIIGYNIKLEIK